MAAPPGEFRLRDGLRVLVRPIEPEDRDRLQVGLHRLSAASRYQRFHAAVSELSPEQLRSLTDVDQVNHIAWIALDPAAAGEPALGVARCIRLPRDPHMAEVAVTVLDAYQGRGLGTLLLGLLSESAISQGIQTFRAYVRGDNDAMLRIFKDLGAVVGALEEGIYQLDIPVPDDPATLPDTSTGRVFKAVAMGHRLRDRGATQVLCSSSRAEPEHRDDGNRQIHEETVHASWVAEDRARRAG